MDNLVRAALAGIAVGGFAAAVVEANQITLRVLFRLNCLAIETACVMTSAVLAKMGDRQPQQQPQDNNFEQHKDEV